MFEPFSYWSSSNVYHPDTFSQRNFSNHENCNIKFPLRKFFDQITICQIPFEIYTSFTSNKSFIQLEQNCKYLNFIWVFPFCIFIFLLKWSKQEIVNKRRPEIHGSENLFREVTGKKVSAHYASNHHCAEISVIWLVDTLAALFKIRFRSLFFDVEKRRQCSEVTAIPWEIFCNRFVKERCF